MAFEYAEFLKILDFLCLRKLEKTWNKSDRTTEIGLKLGSWSPSNGDYPSPNRSQLISADKSQIFFSIVCNISSKCIFQFFLENDNVDTAIWQIVRNTTNIIIRIITTVHTQFYFLFHGEFGSISPWLSSEFLDPPLSPKNMLISGVFPKMTQNHRKISAFEFNCNFKLNFWDSKRFEVLQSCQFKSEEKYLISWKIFSLTSQIFQIIQIMLMCIGIFVQSTIYLSISSLSLSKFTQLDKCLNQKR